MFHTPPLQGRRMEVYRAMFEMQLPDTLEGIRKWLKEWNAVHLILSETGTTRRTLSRDQMRNTIAEKIAPDGAVLDPAVPIDNPLPPTGTILTIMPNAIRPKIAPEYSGWNWMPIVDMRAKVTAFVTKALGSIPAGGLASALFKAKGHKILLDASASTTSTLPFQRLLDVIVNKKGTVVFFDSVFGFTATGEAFLNNAAQVLQMPARKLDMLYFDPASDWYVVFEPGGQVRIGKTG